MQIRNQIAILNKLLKKEFKQFVNAKEEEQAEISQEIFVLKLTRTNLMHSIGLETAEEQRQEQDFTKGNNNDWICNL